jgi:magnesium chelatase family protein
MLARARTFTIEGLQTRPVTVEVDVRPGLPSFTVVGLADAAVREARDRVRAAVLNSGYEFPARRITANLAPGDLPKVGPGFDLALACALLAASQQLPTERLESHALYGELSLDGHVRACHGTLAVAQASHEAGLSTLILSPGRAREACLVEGLEIAVVDSLTSAARVLGGGPGDALPPRIERGETPSDQGSSRELELSDVRGQPQAVRALVVAAAGSHNLLLNGAPGTGKTMLAQRLPSILPPLSRAEAIEVTRLQSITGQLEDVELLRSRPFRCPHHSVTMAGLVGAARGGWVGELALAHRGVLFLDELSEFSRPALEALRQPVEDGRVTIVRAGHCTVYPTRFMLLAATNPCGCGYRDGSGTCRCTEVDLARHRRRLSGPLLDRLDMVTHLGRPTARTFTGPPTSDSSRARAQVTLARERQSHRLREELVKVNAQMDARMLRAYVELDESGERIMEVARHSLLSARGQHRVLRVARTLADLGGSRYTTKAHVAEAMSLRSHEPLDGRRCA